MSEGDLTVERELSPDELREKVFALDHNIKRSLAAGTVAWWACCEQIFLFHREKGWKVLGGEDASLEEWLAQPDVGMSRRLFFRMVAMWRDLVTIKQVPPEALSEVEPSKADEVRPAIMRGDITPERGLDDAKALGKRDLHETYGPAAGDRKPDDALDASAEAERVECPSCGSWVPKTQLREDDAG